MWRFAIAFVAVFGIDQLSKWWVVWQMGLIERLQIDVWPPFLVFRMGWNTGINFGLFGAYSPALRFGLIGLAIAVTLVLAVWAWRMPPGMSQAAAGAIAGGAAGNALDRVMHGAVADFLNMSCCGVYNPFAFNLADVGIFLGAVILLVWPVQVASR